MRYTIDENEKDREKNPMKSNTLGCNNSNNNSLHLFSAFNILDYGYSAQFFIDFPCRACIPGLHLSLYSIHCFKSCLSLSCFTFEL